MVEGIVASVEENHGKANRIWVMDRGMVSEKNVPDWVRYTPSIQAGRSIQNGQAYTEDRHWQLVRRLIAKPTEHHCEGAVALAVDATADGRAVGYG